MNHPTERVIVTEVGMRDGLQSISRIMSTDDKKRWIDAAWEAGIRSMEVASFVPAKLLPQMADAEAVIAHALTLEGLVVTALVPNVKGAQRDRIRRPQDPRTYIGQRRSQPCQRAKDPGRDAWRVCRNVFARQRPCRDHCGAIHRIWLHVARRRAL